MKKNKQQQQELEKKVPRAIFIENVEEVCRKEGIQTLKSSIDQAYNKYRLVQGQLLKSQQNLIGKVPEIEKTVQMITALTSSPNSTVDFMLSEGIFVKGRPKEGLSKISLWLGANTVAQLTFAEALELLNTNLSNAKSSLLQIHEELEYIKQQKTISQVNVARVHNFSIAQKRAQQMEQN